MTENQTRLSRALHLEAHGYRLMSDGDPEFIARLDAERASRAAEALVARGEIDRRDLFEQVEATRRLTASPAEAREVLAHQIHARQAQERMARVREEIELKQARINEIEQRELEARRRAADAGVAQMVALQLVPDYDAETLASWRQRFVADPSLIERTLQFGRSSRF